jgi:hypothetical protein
VTQLAALVAFWGILLGGINIGLGVVLSFAAAFVVAMLIAAIASRFAVMVVIA